MRLRFHFIGMLMILAACQPRPATALPSTPILPTITAALASTPLPGALFFDNFKMFDSGSGWAWTGLSQLYRTDDAGATWRQILLQGRMQVTGAEFLDGQHAWLLGVPDANLKQGVFQTVDGGRTWTELSQLQGPNASVSFHDLKTGWALNGMAAAGNLFYQVFQTLDGGRSWEQLQITSTGGNVQGPSDGMIHLATGDTMSFTPPQTIWITSGYGISTPYAGLTVSRDNGQTWEQLNPALPADYVSGQPPVTVAAPQFVSDKDVYLPLTVGQRLIFFTSHDSGHSWALLPSALPSSQMVPRVQFVTVNDGFAACGPDLCITHDGATTWQKVAAPFSFDRSKGGAFVSQFEFVDVERGWAILIDQDGRASFIKTDDGGRTWIALEVRLSF